MIEAVSSMATTTQRQVCEFCGLKRAHHNHLREDDSLNEECIKEQLKRLDPLVPVVCRVSPVLYVDDWVVKTSMIENIRFNSEKMRPG
jgi:hypothetical protein